MTTLQYANLKSQKDKEKMKSELLRQNLDLISRDNLAVFTLNQYQIILIF